MDILTSVMEQNPWWLDAGSIEADEKVVESGGSIGYVARLAREIKYDFPDRRAVMYALRGPRQVGKTTLVKQQIRQFLHGRSVHPLNILYYAMDLAEKPEDIVDVVRVYMEQTRRRRKDARCYLFLDEISSVPDWQRGIKYLADAGMLRNCTVLATGSHILDLKGAAERLPGRRGDVDGGHDKILLPMRFSEYVSVLSPQIRRTMRDKLPTTGDRKSAIWGLAGGAINGQVEELAMHRGELNGLLDDYMTTGGFPRVVAGHAASQTLRDPDYETYVGVVTGEWSRLGKDTASLKRFGGQLCTNLGSPVSWRGLAKGALAGSPNTAQDYADALERLFITSTIYMYDINKRAPLFSKNKKIYFTDPFFLHAFRTWSSSQMISESSIAYLGSGEGRGRMLECVTADHLTRLAFDLTPAKSTFDHHNHVFYWRDRKSREVDFVLDDGHGLRLPIGVKSGDNPGDIGGMLQFLKTQHANGIVLTRERMEERRNYLILPASVFLALV